MANNKGQSRLFTVLVVALVGLLIAGLFGIGGVFIISNTAQQQTVAIQPTATLVFKLPPPSPTPLPQVEEPTPAQPTPTNTPVVPKNSDAEPVSSQRGSSNVTPTTEGSADDSSTEAAEAEVASEPTPKPSPTPTKEIGGGADTASALQSPQAETVPNTGLSLGQTFMLALGLITAVIIVRRMRVG